MSKNTFDIPGGYDVLPLGKYLDVLKACGEMKDGGDMATVGILAALSGRTEDEVLDMPVGEFTELAARARYLEGRPEAGKPRGRYELGGFTLIPARDMRGVTAAQYIDFQTFARGGMQSAPQVLSCMLVPEGMKYADGYDPVEVQAAIREHMCVTDAFTLYAFFLKSLRRSIADILSCSAPSALAALPRGSRLKAALKTARAIVSLRAGDGSRAWTRSRRRAGARGRRSGR